MTRTPSAATRFHASGGIASRAHQFLTLVLSCNLNEFYHPWCLAQEGTAAYDLRPKGRASAEAGLGSFLNPVMDEPHEASQCSEERDSYGPRQAAAGTAVAEVCRQFGVSEATLCVRTKKFAHLGVSGSCQMRQLG